MLTLAHEIRLGPTPEVEEIQDIVERVLLDSPFHRTAKAYILYREQHAQIRSITYGGQYVSLEVEVLGEVGRGEQLRIHTNPNSRIDVDEVIRFRVIPDFVTVIEDPTFNEEP